ncbi:alpha/beta hydrolase [Pseudorhodobacter aquimaris]|uniref:alpha/beta hydrolase n=1 Tax=Pseudorhodobacter aquimaris TaxID=687412 RepID=UPI000AD4BFB3|nr:alpha/beta hydrolase [Pseudorhodobacter aquimaris]
MTKAPAGGAPLIFAFHGTGGDETQFFGLARQIAPDAGIVSPCGNVSEGGARRFFKRTGEGVYDMQDLARRTEAMARFIAAHKADNPGSAAYGFGYSNGANILASVALKHTELFDRIGLLHPLIPWPLGATPGLSGKRVLITAGRRDPICPWPASQRLIDWFTAQGADISTEIHEGGHDLRQPELVALQTLLTAP